MSLTPLLVHGDDGSRSIVNSGVVLSLIVLICRVEPDFDLI